MASFGIMESGPIADGSVGVGQALKPLPRNTLFFQRTDQGSHPVLTALHNG